MRHDGRMPITALDVRRPFTRAEALAAGISVRQLAGPRFVRLLHNRYVSASVEVTTELRATAALSVVGVQGHVSHCTSARLWGAWAPECPDIHVSTPRSVGRTRRLGTRWHVASPDGDVVVRRGLRLSSPIQAFLDLARTLSLVDLVAVGDSLVRRGHVTPDDLIIRANRWQGNGAVQARRAARLVRTGVDSPMETRLRLLVVLAGLPEPVVNHTLRLKDGSWQVRFDLSYPQWRIAIEYDGRQHAESDRQWQHDIDRRELMDRLDWRLIVVRSPDLFVDPSGTLRRITEALADRGVRGIALRGDEWRRHFPGRRVIA